MGWVPSEAVAPDSRLQGATKWVVKYIFNMNKFDFLVSKNFKLIMKHPLPPKKGGNQL